MDDKGAVLLSTRKTSVADHVKMFNVVLLGNMFMLVFTAFSTTGMISKNVLDRISLESNGTYSGDAFMSQSIIYATFAVSNWLAPSVIALIGLRFSMFCGALTYCFYVGQFLYPDGRILYLSSALLGVGAAVLWTAQGSALTISSNKETMGRNTGIFWAMFQCSLLFGSAFEFFLLRGQPQFDEHTRYVLFSTFSGIAVFGSLSILLFRQPDDQASTTTTHVKLSTPWTDSIHAFERSFRLFKTRRMLLLSFPFAYTAVSMAFGGGVYPSCIGQNSNFEDSKSLIGLTGMAMGIGGILGGLLTSIFRKLTNLLGRDSIVALSFFIHLVAFLLSYLNFPDDCPIAQTENSAYMTSSFVAISGGFLLGIGDACINTQLYSMLGFLYSDAESSASAFAVFKFVQSFFAAVAFFYAKALLKSWLFIITVLNVAATCTFLLVIRQHPVFRRTKL